MLRVRLPPDFHALAARWHRCLLLVMAGLAATIVGWQPSDLPQPQPLAFEPSRVVMVVVDGLRVDEADDSKFLRSMPFRAIATVECPLPSSTAAIETWVTGRVPGGESFLRDFDDSPRSTGGLLERLSAAGQPAFVAGPALWTGRFGQWIDGVGDWHWGTSDATRVAAMEKALVQSRPGLHILHLDALDRIGHIDPSAAGETVATIDATVEGLASRLRPSDLLLVLSDHGRRLDGGHAGREFVVTQTPLLASHPLPLPRETTQAAFAASLAEWLDVPRASPPAPSRPISLIVAVSLAVILLVRVSGSEDHTATGLAIASGVTFLCLLGGLTIGVIAAAIVAGIVSGGNIKTVRRSRGSLRMIVLGVGYLAARILMPAVLPSGSTAFLIGTGVAIGLLLVFGSRIGTAGRLVTALLVVAVLQGQTASLSSIQTAVGFRFAASLGLPWGVAATIVLHTAPLVLLGVMIGRRAGPRTAVSEAMPWVVAGATAVAIAAALAGGESSIVCMQAMTRLLCETALVGLGTAATLLGEAKVHIRVASRTRHAPQA